MKFLSVCSGIESFSVACEPLGYSPVAYSEIDPFACAVLAARFGASRPRYMPDPAEHGISADEARGRRNALKALDSVRFGNLVPNAGDFTALGKEPDLLVEAELLVGGPPCQDFSLAGVRAGLDGQRGNLTLEYVRLLNAIDDLRLARGRPPAVALYENVPGLLSDKTNAFGCFLAGLVGADAPLVPPGGLRWTDSGLVVGPRRKAAWRILDAQHFELPQRRERVFVVVSAREGFDPSRVLFEPEGVRRFAPPRRGEGSEASGAAEGGPGGGGEPIPFNPTQLTSAENRSNPQPGDPAPTLITDGKPPAIAFTTEDRGPVAIAFSLRGRDGENMIEPEPEDLAPALRTGGGGSDKPFVATVYPLQYAGTEGSKGQNGLGVGGEGDPSYTLDTSEPHGVAIVEGRRYVVRKLLPIECERLQGFPELSISVHVRLWGFSDHPENSAPAETPNPRSLSSVWSAEGDESAASAPPAEASSFTCHLDPEKPVPPLVLIDLERREARLLSPENRTSPVSGAEGLSSSLPSIDLVDFVRLAALTISTAVSETLDGRAESPPLSERSTERWSGHRFVELFGGEIAAPVGDAVIATDQESQPSTSTMSEAGSNSLSFDSTLKTLCSYVALAIASSTQGRTWLESSSGFDLRISGGYTAVEFRGKPAADGPRYHALGNTKATKVVRWLGARILAEAARG